MVDTIPAMPLLAMSIAEINYMTTNNLQHNKKTKNDERKPENLLF